MWTLSGVVVLRIGAVPPHEVMTTVDGWLRRRPWLPDLGMAAVLAVLLAPSSLSTVWATDWPEPLRFAAAGAFIAGHLAYIARRWQPEAAYAVGCVEMLLLLLTPDLDGAAAASLGGRVPAILLPSSLVFPLLLYAVARYGRWRWPGLALAVALAGAVLATVRMVAFSQWNPSQSLALRFVFILAALVAVVLAAWTLGRLRRVRAAYVVTLEERAARAEEDRRQRVRQAAVEERARIAREMHDVVAHSLSVMVAQAEGGRMMAARDPARAVPVFDTIATTGREALTDMRGLLGILRGGPASDAGGDTAGRSPQPTLAEVPELVDRVTAAGLPVTLHQTGTPGDPGRSGELAAYRVIQEALTNVVKHAGAGVRAEVVLRWSDRDLVVVVSDNGRGLAEETGDAGHGMIGMRERLAQLGGTLTVDTAPGGGFAVTATIPLRSPPAAPGERRQR